MRPARSICRIPGKGGQTSGGAVKMAKKACWCKVRIDGKWRMRNERSWLEEQMRSLVDFN